MEYITGYAIENPKEEHHLRRISHTMHKIFHISLVCFIVLGCAGYGIQKDGADLSSSGKHHISSAYEPDRYPVVMETKASTVNTAEIASGEIFDIAKGDLVTMHYTARLKNDTILYTTLSDVVDDPRIRKSAWYVQREQVGPEQIVAGGENDFPGLGLSIIGMKKGEKATIAIPPEQAFGVYDKQNIFHFNSIMILPRITSIPKNEFIELFSVDPLVGEKVYLVPYFESDIITVKDNEVILESIVAEATVYEEEYGTTEIHEEGENIIIRLIPKIGAPFRVEDAMGRITRADKNSFTVDLNHPLAGERIIVDLEILTITKASSIPESITWMDNHDQGLSLAREKGKPVILVLYSENCLWCEKMMVETFTDARIRVLNDRFVWVRIDSSIHTDLYDLYDQVGYPMTVVLSPDGKVVTRIDGYRPAHEVRQELEEVIGQTLP